MRYVVNRIAIFMDLRGIPMRNAVNRTALFMDLLVIQMLLAASKTQSSKVKGQLDPEQMSAEEEEW